MIFGGFISTISAITAELIAEREINVDLFSVILCCEMATSVLKNKNY
jgi:hypothetical protein